MRKLAWVLGIVLLAAVAAVAFVGPAFADREDARDGQLVGSGGTYWSHCQSIGTTSTMIPTSTAGAAVNALFPAGDLSRYAAGREHSYRAPVVSVGGAGTCCWTQHLVALNIDSMNVSDVAGPNGSAPGACFRFEGAVSGYALERPDRKLMIEADVGGERSGVCSSAVESAGDGASDASHKLYAPCDADADCSSYGAGTCTTSGWSMDQQGRAGVFLMCEMDAASTNVCIWKQEIKR